MKRTILMLVSFLATLPMLALQITGQVLGENDSPLDFVNVVIHRDSTYITGTITDANGHFLIDVPSAGPLTARVTFTGYEEMSASVPQSGRMGVLRLKPRAVELGEVVVSASRPVTVIKGNSLVTNVEGSSLSIAGTARDVLARVPMVIDNGGVLEVFGKGAPAVYINGRLVNDKQELAQLNSRDIKSVEVITNPGAAYAANVKSVIRIRTKPPRGDGWSGTLRTDNGFARDFRTGNTIDLKYRTGGLEVFANYGWWRGHSLTVRTDLMTTVTPKGVCYQRISTDLDELYNDMNGRVGFSWLVNDRHSLGAYYRNGWNRHTLTGHMPAEVWLNGQAEDMLDLRMADSSNSVPLHSANVYYNGTVGKLSIDFNADYLGTKGRHRSNKSELSMAGSDRDVLTIATDRYSMIAEKTVLFLPLWRGTIEAGEEYSATRYTNITSSNIPEIPAADSRVDESNMAVFSEISQRFSAVKLGAGLRYEHVRFRYYEGGQLRGEQSRVYENMFSSLSMAAQAGAVRLAINFASKTARPGYGQLDGAITYVNRFTFETGNPRLKPVKMRTAECMAQWRQMFAQLSYTYFKDGVYEVTEPYGADGEATIIRTANLPHRHYLQAFIGGQFRWGIWRTSVGAGVSKQWLTLPADGKPMRMDTPGFTLQWQNAIKIPLDIWLNVDAQVMTPQWDNNLKMTNTPWLVNAKLYKGFLADALGVTLEAKDIFNSSQRDATLYNDAVKIVQLNHSPQRSVMLTVQYRFNTPSDRYRGTGAGNAEKSRM